MSGIEDKPIHSDLDHIISKILSKKTSDDELKLAVNDFRDYLLQTIPSDLYDDLIKIKENKTLKGIALHPLGAINCLTDTWRTVKFIRGINSAIVSLLDKFPKQKIHIVYAGSGPLAPLIIPSCKIFTNDQIKITFLDINQSSLDSVKNLFSLLEIENYINDIVCVDAAQYEVSADEKIHMIVSETMYPALYKEGQVAVSFNLGRQLISGGILIPEEVSINAVLINSVKEIELIRKRVISTWLLNIFPFNRFYRKDFGKIFALNLEQIKEYVNHIGAKDFALPERIDAGQIKLTKIKNKNYQLMLSTKIKIFNEIILEEYESGLTCPRSFYKDGIYKKGKIIKFYYELSECPQFKIGVD